MEENKAPQNFSQLCKLGCGYFGSSNFDGLCSQCYKEREDCEGFSRCQGVIREEREERKKTDEEIKETVKVQQIEERPSLVEKEKDKTEVRLVEPAIVITTHCEPKAVVVENSAKKSRCNICRKKLGLTGFGCRCGGEFCSIHRYSDSHSCTFDYKIEAENAIRKANPRIVSNKVSKI